MNDVLVFLSDWIANSLAHMLNSNDKSFDLFPWIGLLLLFVCKWNTNRRKDKEREDVNCQSTFNDGILYCIEHIIYHVLMLLHHPYLT